MARVIRQTTKLQAHGTPPKTIEEYIGRVNSGTTELSIARMLSPAGWSEPGQTPEFGEYTLVLNGLLVAETRDQTYRVEAGHVMIVKPGEWVRYSTPDEAGAEYIAVALPAFSPEAVHRSTR